MLKYLLYSYNNKIKGEKVISKNRISQYLPTYFLEQWIKNWKKCPWEKEMIQTFSLTVYIQKSNCWI